MRVNVVGFSTGVAGRLPGDKLFILNAGGVDVELKAGDILDIKRVVPRIYSKNVCLSNIETDVLEKLLDESSNQGHDFGLLEEVEWDDKYQLGGVFTNLQKKGIVISVDKVKTNRNWTQYVLCEEVISKYEKHCKEGLK